MNGHQRIITVNIATHQPKSSSYDQ